MPTPESASAAAYGGQPGGLPYGSAPPGGAPGNIGFGVSTNLFCLQQQKDVHVHVPSNFRCIF